MTLQTWFSRGKAVAVVGLCSGLLALTGCATTPPPAASAPSANESGSAAPVAASNPAPAATPMIEIPNARNPLPGVITGGQPSDDNLRAAKSAGYKTIISLLPETETGAEATLASELGLRFVSIPVRGPDDLTEQNAKKLADAMDAADAKPLILHCGGGNRAGALLALKAFYVDHASSDAALALGESAGLRALKSAVEDRMRTAAR